MDVFEEYKKKLKTPDEAVKVVKDGDWVDYSHWVTRPILLDQALARRKDELSEVFVRGVQMRGPVAIADVDPEREHFIYNEGYLSGDDRRRAEKAPVYYCPMTLRDYPKYYREFLHINVAMMQVSPMDRHGFFSLSASAGMAGEVVKNADTVILEVNEHFPRIHGGPDTFIHISDADIVVEGPHEPFPEKKPARITDVDRAIAGYIFPYIRSGATLQLGIGGIPDAVGSLIANSDLKNLGMHSELCSDAFLDIHNAGKLTGKYKNVLPGKNVLALAGGSRQLMEWVDDNPSMEINSVSFVNDPAVMGQIDNFISINSCLTVDLYGQINAETTGLKQLAGSGGQLDFVEGAARSKGGASFVCLPSTFTDKQGVRHSNILPHFNGEIATCPRSVSFFIATEYGAECVMAATVWQRAEKLISLAHPDFREELIRAAEDQGIWRRSNKR
ncbi:MAG: acetyl-CoA hydrolase/transferase family protein [Anaerovoracaceae bacterium]|jgi:acyl-CoA hydrolase